MSTPQWKKDAKRKARKAQLEYEVLVSMEQLGNAELSSIEQWPELQRLQRELIRAKEKALRFSLKVF